MARRRPSSPDVEALRRSVAHGVPTEAVAIFGRWWQLETWLRLLVTVELIARFGQGWLAQVSRRALDRATSDEINAYMGSPDSTDPMAYLDTGELFALIDSDDLWSCFEGALLPRVRWRGAADMLNAIRRRSAHCRRPHEDDLSRLEQVLRDLEPGAQRFLAAFGNQRRIWRVYEDPVGKTWIDPGPQVAELLDQALRNDVEFELRWSLRPWVAGPPEESAITGTPGALWHAEWRSNAPIDLRRVWTSEVLDADARSSMLVTQDRASRMVLTLPAVDEAARTNRAIQRFFEAFMLVAGGEEGGVNFDRTLGTLDPRLHIADPLANTGPSFSEPIFDAPRLL